MTDGNTQIREWIGIILTAVVVIGGGVAAYVSLMVTLTEHQVKLQQHSDEINSLWYSMPKEIRTQARQRLHDYQHETAGE